MPFRTVVTMVVVSAAVAALADEVETGLQERNLAVVRKIHKADLLQYGDVPDVFVRPGLLADRRIQQVRIVAEATGLAGKEIAEFLLIGEQSSHGYESLAVAFAKPSDVHAALEFIGMKAGRSVDSRKLQLWPKGERVLLSASGRNPTSVVQNVRMEALLSGAGTGEAMPASGLVFTGSRLVPARDDAGIEVYAADEYDPRSIAANYNESSSVLVVPGQAPKNRVYGSQLVNPAYVLPAYDLLNIVMEPEYKNGRMRVVDLGLTVMPGPANPTNAKADLSFCLQQPDGVLTNMQLNDVLAVFTGLVEDGHDPFVGLQFDEVLKLGDIHELCKLLASIETVNGIRIEPPAVGQLYYRAFLPNEDFRNREDRFAQPWELRIETSDSSSAGSTGILTRITEVWHDDVIKPELQIVDHEIGTPADMGRILKKEGSGLPVILVFAARDLTYGDIMPYLRPVLKDYDTVYVFLDKP